jgi:glycerophosphoryl diester phosphodiesterase
MCIHVKSPVAPGRPLVLAFSLTIAIVATLLQVAGAHADGHWNPSSILKILKQGSGQVIIAHRGLYEEKGCPENSLCSIEQAYVSDIEGIELDVRQSKEGTPWLFHEQNVGRLIAHDPSFNPFQDSPVGWDPDLRSLTDEELRSSFLRDKSGATTSYRPLSLEGALATINSRGWDHMVVVLDIKTSDAVSRAADLAIRYGLKNAVVLKFSSSLLAVSSGAYFDLKDITKGLPFVPTMYASDMAKIMQEGWRYADCEGQSAAATNQCTVTSWIMDLQDRDGYAWLEVGNKLPVDSDPTYFLLESPDLGAVGGFQPVPEFPDRTGPGHSYVRSNGTCCASLSDYLTPANDWFPGETQDGREDIHNLWDHGFSSVITDNPQGAIQATTHRNTALYE